MDFAKQQLLKFGWTEGKGLGKNEDGISEAIKPKLKFDTTGVGHNSSEQFTFNWWENVFNNAADNINITKTKGGEVNIGLNSEDSVNITTKKYSIKNKGSKNKGLQYGSFLKTSKLTAEGVVDHDEKDTCNYQEDVIKTVNLTDEELFAACGGRTAHKGARHGFKLNGKLSRIEEQERKDRELFIKIWGDKDKNTEEKKQKKPKKKTEESTEITSNDEIIDENVPLKSKKKYKIKESSEENVETESDTNKEIRKKKKRKRKRDKSHEKEYEDFIEEEAAKKKYENFCDKKYRKKLKIKRKKEEKTFSKISELFENCSIDKPEKSDDDGFDESINKKKIKLMVDEDAESLPKKLKKKSKKKKKKCKEDKATQKFTDDAGFCELMSEISDKLVSSKELRKKLKKEKKKLDDARISKISEELSKVCTV